MALHYPVIHSKLFNPAEPPYSASWPLLPNCTPRPPPYCHLASDQDYKLTIDLTYTEVNLLQEKTQDQKSTFYIRHSRAK